MWRLICEFASFLKQEKKWWLLPMLVLLLLLGLLIAAGSGSALSPLLYPFLSQFRGPCS
jgi:hypothetical protein